MFVVMIMIVVIVYDEISVVLMEMLMMKLKWSRL